MLGRAGQGRVGGVGAREVGRGGGERGKERE